MKFNDVAYKAVEQMEACSLIYDMTRFWDIEEIKDRS